MKAKLVKESLNELNIENIDNSESYKIWKNNVGKKLGEIIVNMEVEDDLSEDDLVNIWHFMDEVSEGHDPFEEYDKEIYNMFMSRTDPEEAAVVILKMMAKVANKFYAEQDLQESVKENFIRWSGKDVTKMPIIGKVITKEDFFGPGYFPSKEYDIVEIVEEGNRGSKIYVANFWYKNGVPQIIPDQLVDEYIEYNEPIEQDDSDKDFRRF